MQDLIYSCFNLMNIIFILRKKLLNSRTFHLLKFEKSWSICLETKKMKSIEVLISCIPRLGSYILNESKNPSISLKIDYYHKEW